MKIYTKTGDKGMTSILGGTKLNKHHIRIEAYGTVDELNACIGLLISEIEVHGLRTELTDIQNYLFVVGSHLAADPENSKFELPTLSEDYTAALEKSIDAMSAQVPSLRYFVLPGGSKTSALAHICRTVCRRAERRVVELASAEFVNPSIVVYLNRLSDYFFMCARYLNHLAGVSDIPWKGREG